ncbi:hypothetical protein DYBT9275_02724 [Dyadobacter sp. CECT 9275]|uniref:Uncharacterized protein n=1 Tax=Dyadobacter helix TaxID=2822344 RepID=A0A916JC50_9BACT|nr:hypothetical protein [Dyadobacter sp. CECT 9275]CAG5001701.1 hypothetical protein DYBT9275_02724 [Dyadobacter sp. CECT 9275]
MTTEITFPGNIPGMNGKNGLLRTNWRKRNRIRDKWIWHVKAATKNKHPGQVKLLLTRYGFSTPLDYDNLVATGKILIDAMVHAGVIVDDKPAIISEREYVQVKTSKDGQKTVITITDL